MANATNATNETATEATTPNADRVVRIPAENGASLEKRLAKLAKRAEKLGCPIGWRWGPAITGVRTVKCPAHELCAGCEGCDGRGGPRHEISVFYDITVSTSRPGFAGWEFLGTLDHTSVAGAVMRRMVPGVECPAEAVASKPGWCDHCRKVRARTETFVVRHEGGAVKVVGRNCIRDFLGHECPADIASKLSFVTESLAGALDEESGLGTGGGGGRPWEVCDILGTLALVSMVERIDGAFRPRALDNPTSGVVSTLLWGSGKLAYELRSHYYRANGGRTLADVERAWNALAWLCDARASNDFLHNLKSVASAPYLLMKNLGIFCAIVPAYDREAVKRSTRADRPASMHVGTVGKREDFGGGVVERIFSHEGTYGTTYRFVIRLDSGAVLGWWASSAQDVAMGDRVSVRATVKRHGEHNGTPQTEITRATLTKL